MTALAALVIAVTVAALTVPTPPTAEAATTGLGQWRFRNGVICVEDHGSTFWPTRQAVARWNVAPDLYIVAWKSCASFPLSQKVILRAYDNPGEYACGKTDPGPWLDPGGLVRQMTIWLNVAPRWRSGCFATTGQRAHVISHELGHAFGLAHRAGQPSVMASWAYQWPTSLDLATIEARYPW